MPPCTSFDDRLEVPDAQSLASSRPTLKPRVTASRALPVPTMPPPTTRMSSSFDFRRSIAAARSSGPSFVDLVTELSCVICKLPSPSVVLASTLVHSVRRDNYLHPLKFLDSAVAGGGHRAAK